MFTTNRGTVNQSEVRNACRQAATSFTRIRLLSCVASRWSQRMASYPASCTASTISRTPVTALANSTCAVCAPSDTSTRSTPGSARIRDSTVAAHPGVFIPYTLSVAAPCSASSSTAASNPVSSISLAMLAGVQLLFSSYSTTARSASSATDTERIPGCARSAFSMLATHAPQVIPPIRS